jgi:hypothetical protein
MPKCGIAMFFTIASYLCLAQISAITDNGDSVLLFDNGRWEFKKSEENSLENEVKIQKDETDPFEGNRTIVTETWINFAGDDHTIMLGSAMMIDSIYGFNLGLSSEIGCLKKAESKIKILLENQALVELVQVSDDNCAKIPTATFFLVENEFINSDEFMQKQKDNLLLLQQFDWVSMKVEGSESSMVVYPISRKEMDGKKFFKRHIEALIKASLK